MLAREIRRSLSHSRQAALSLVAALSALGLAAAHWQVLSRGEDYSGVLLVFDHVFDIALAAAVLAICACVGRMALARCEHFFDQAVESLLFALAVGTGIVASAILILGLVGRLGPWLLGLLLSACLLISRREVPKLAGVLRRSFDEVKNNTQAMDRFIFGAVVVFILAQALLPPWDWDSLVYHLEIPKLYLAKGQIYPILDNMRASYVQLANMLYLPLLAFGSASGPAVLSAFFTAALGLTVFAFSRRFLNAFCAGKGLSLLWGSPVLIVLAITPRVDMAMAFYLFLCQYALLRVLFEEQARALWLPAAVLLGCAVGVKLSAAAYAIALSPLILWTAYKRQRAVVPAAKSVFLFGCVSLLAYSPWLLKNCLVTPFPLAPFPYPHQAKEYMEPWLAACYAAARQSLPDHIADITSLIPITSHNLLYLFYAPEHIWPHDLMSARPLNGLCLGVPLLWALFFRVAVLNWLIVPALVYLLMFVYVFHIPHMRYLVPMITPLTVASIFMLERFAARFLSRPAVNRLFAACAILVLLPAMGLMHALLREAGTFSHLLGQVSRQQALLDYSREALDANYQKIFMPIVMNINQHVPRHSRILMIFDGRGYYFQTPVMPDVNLTNWQLLSKLSSPLECLHAQGITHVLVAFGCFHWYANLPWLSSLREPEAELRSFCSKNLILDTDYERAGYVLYRVKGS